MKTVITSSNNKMESDFDLRFGRAAWFCVYDHSSGQVNFVENINNQSNSGAGKKTAELMAELGVGRVLSGDFGPKAKQLLKRLKIQMIIPEQTQTTISELIDTIK